MDEMERRARMAAGGMEEIERIPIGVDYDWLQPQAREAVFAYEAYFSDYWPDEYRKAEIRQCKINLLMRVLDNANHGYEWLFRFDEKWEPLKPWEKHSVGALNHRELERHKKLTLRAGITKFSSYDDIIPNRNKRSILWKRLSDYETRELFDELIGRIKPWIGRRWRLIIRPLKLKIQIGFLARRVLFRDKMRKNKVWLENAWFEFWRIK